MPQRADGRVVLHHLYERATCIYSNQLPGDILSPTVEKQKSVCLVLEDCTYQSPLPVFRPLGTPSLGAFPAAAEAKFDVNGEGMAIDSQASQLADE